MNGDSSRWTSGIRARYANLNCAGATCPSVRDSIRPPPIIQIYHTQEVNMKKVVIMVVIVIGFVFSFPFHFSANEGEATNTKEVDSEAQEQGDAYNDLGIKKGTKVYGEDISELSEEELQYIPEGWRDGHVDIVEAFDLKDTGVYRGIRLDNVSASHKRNVSLLAQHGVTNQLNDFRPGETVTRGQFATFVYEAMQE